MKRVLVTGVSGFVGANLARRLLTDGHAVHGLVRPTSDLYRLEAIRSDLRLHTASIEDAGATVREIKPDWIFHLAAYGGSIRETDPDEMLLTNEVGTATLVNACVRQGFEAFVHTGSSAEYGPKDHAPAESEPLAPNTLYGKHKAWASRYCFATALKSSLPIWTLRLYSVYGPWEDSRRLIPTLIEHGLRGTLPPLVHPETARDFIHIDDVVRACVLLAERKAPPGAIFNLGTGRQTTMREMVDLARRVFGFTVEPQWGTLPDRPWDTSVWVSDPHAIESALGFRASIDLETGFKATADWSVDRRS